MPELQTPLRRPGPFDGYLRAQLLAKECIRTVAELLTPGVSERAVSGMLAAEARGNGAEGFFHRPRVLFGERTAFVGIKSRRDAEPSGKSLANDSPVIFDFAPVFGGFPADVSMTIPFGNVPELKRGNEALAEFRRELPVWVSEASEARAIHRRFREWSGAKGLHCLQDGYLFGSLAHRLSPGSKMLPGGLHFMSLGLPFAFGLLGSALGNRVPGIRCTWPFWTDSRAASGSPGLWPWSVEPHLGLGPIGFKSQELLVPEDGGWRWLE